MNRHLTVLFLILLTNFSFSQVRTIILTQTHADAIKGIDRKAWAGLGNVSNHSAGYANDFTLPAKINPCEKITNVKVEIKITKYSNTSGCGVNPTYFNLFYGCNTYSGGATCLPANVIAEPNYPPNTPGATLNFINNNNKFNFGGILSVDIIPVSIPCRPVLSGGLTYEYTTTVTVTITDTPLTLEIIDPAPVCSGGTVDIKLPAVTVGSTTGTTLTYWTDAAATIALLNPSAINTSGTYYIKSTIGSCSITKPVLVSINSSGGVPTPGVFPVSYCQNSISPSLTATAAPTATLNWYGINAIGGSASATPTVASTTSVGQIKYYVSQTIGTCESPRVAVDVTIKANVTPSFAPIPNSYCQNASAPALQTSSTNSTAITGAWNPLSINTSSVGTTNYIFTPTAGQCATNLTIPITINTNVTPSFAPIPNSYCQNATAPVLETSSTNTTAITGNWNPASISTSNVGTATYTFTPTTGQCATSLPLSITINANVTPSFLAIPKTYCQNATAPVLDTSSTNTTAIIGTWNPDSINTSNVGTATYTFTPTTGECVTSLPISITINANEIPTFAAIPTTYCQNATAPVLETSSTNTTAITGTWNPTSISTSNVGTATYTFTPTTGQCATSLPLSITINANVTPSFLAIPTTYCENATAPALQTSSTNTTAITGTWDPVSINTSSVGTATYTFTPTTGECATSLPISITINVNEIPTFATIPNTYCQNATAPVLETSSTNTTAITGTWNPTSISTSSVGTTNYIFTPTAGQCATSLPLSITINANEIPTFAAIPTTYCENATAPALQTSSTNTTAITGTWNPASISTSNVGTATYTFTPTTGECVTSLPLSITINANEIPTFAAIPTTYCQNATAPVLETSSSNSTAITGTWNPAFISTSNVGTATYTFTPTTGKCATTKDLTITINNPSVSITAGCIATNYTLEAIPSDSNVTYSWFKDNAIVNNQSANTFVVKDLGTYKVIINSDGCNAEAIENVTVLNCNTPNIPKGVSPNNDTFNDTFDLSNFNVSKLEIFNRYGIKVYSKSNYKNEWNGTSDDGQELPDATYYYVVEFEGGDTKTGWVYLNRKN